MRYTFEEKKVMVLQLTEKGYSISAICALICSTSDYVMSVLHNYELQGHQVVEKALNNAN